MAKEPWEQNDPLRPAIDDDVEGVLNWESNAVSVGESVSCSYRQWMDCVERILQESDEDYARTAAQRIGVLAKVMDTRPLTDDERLELYNFERKLGQTE